MNLVWFAIGSLAGVLFVSSQWLTLVHLPLDNPRKARWWVFRSALVRLVMMAGLFISALRQEVTLMIMVVAGWWLARSLTLYCLSNNRSLAPAYLDLTNNSEG